MHCICRFESPYSWRVGNTAHFYGSVLLETLPSQAQLLKRIRPRRHYIKFSATVVLVVVLLSQLIPSGEYKLGTKASQQPAHTVMAEWHPTYVEKLALTSEAGRSENGY